MRIPITTIEDRPIYYQKPVSGSARFRERYYEFDFQSIPRVGDVVDLPEGKRVVTEVRWASSDDVMYTPRITCAFKL